MITSTFGGFRALALATVVLALTTSCSRPAEPAAEVAVAPPPPLPRACNAEETKSAEIALLDYGTSHHGCVGNPQGFTATASDCMFDPNTNLISVRGEVDFSDSVLNNMRYAFVIKGTVGLATNGDLQIVSRSDDYEGVCKFNETASAITSK